MKKGITIICIFSILSFLAFKENKGYNHLFSDTFFAYKTGNFNFIGQKNYDDVGKDISVGYKSASKVELTHYVYPSENVSLKSHFDGYKNSLLSEKSNIKCLETKEIITSKMTGMFSKFSLTENFYGSDKKVNSYLYMYKCKGWFIMIRITCEPQNNQVKEKDIEGYLTKMQFPKKECK
jgi:hypothetical protein